MLFVIGTIYGMIIGIVPTLLFFESYRWIRHKTTIPKPFLTVLLTSVLCGVLFALYQFNTARVESGFAAAALFASIVAGSIFSGLILATYYNKIIIRKIIEKQKYLKGWQILGITCGIIYLIFVFTVGMIPILFDGDPFSGLKLCILPTILLVNIIIALSAVVVIMRRPAYSKRKEIICGIIVGIIYLINVLITCILAPKLFPGEAGMLLVPFIPVFFFPASIVSSLFKGSYYFFIVAMIVNALFYFYVGLLIARRVVKNK